MSQGENGTVGLVWRGKPASRGTAIAETSRLYPIARALQALGVAVQPVVYSEEIADQVRDQLLRYDGVLVWVDPITNGRDRTDLDAILRHLSSEGVWVSAHPDVILKMGTKEILYQTREMGWGTDTRLYGNAEEFNCEFPKRLAADGTRVLKQHRGNGGIGIWKVSLQSGASADTALVAVQQARGQSEAATQRLDEFMANCAGYFEGAGRVIDQAYQSRIDDGIARCYMSANACVGFARQYPKGYGTAAAAEAFGLPSDKTMYGPSEPQFARLREKMEREWVPQMRKLLDIDEPALPALWDADFLFGPRDTSGADTYVLCEINISCVSPFPPDAPAKIAETVAARLAAAKSLRSP